MGTARGVIAQAAAGQNDADELLAAERGLQAALQHWNNVAHWDFLLTNASAITVGSGTADYALPANFKSVYTARLQTLKIYLQYTDQRPYDQYDPAAIAGTPTHYTLLAVGAIGSISLIPPPSAPDSLLLRYYRRMAIPVDGDTAAAIDIPQDYEHYLFALAKAYYLGQRPEAEPSRVQFWMAIAEDGIARAKARQVYWPDAVPGFVPGGQVGATLNPNDIRPYWDY